MVQQLLPTYKFIDSLSDDVKEKYSLSDLLGAIENLKTYDDLNVLLKNLENRHKEGRLDLPGDELLHEILKSIMDNEINEKIDSPKTAKTMDREKQDFYILNRMEIIDMLEETDIPDSEFKEKIGQIDKRTAISFIKDGRPSQYYFEEILNILGEHGADISNFIL